MSWPSSVDVIGLDVVAFSGDKGDSGLGSSNISHPEVVLILIDTAADQRSSQSACASIFSGNVEFKPVISNTSESIVSVSRGSKVSAPSLSLFAVNIGLPKFCSEANLLRSTKRCSIACPNSCHELSQGVNGSGVSISGVFEASS